ncbi:MAG: hypothetical protein SP1CHLAM54_16960 [Chlamydiia bacterium]|nr:hypothetical protein [Chlamydiia bacterium]MCH9616584.1 hypothetical protein [Chlamydiia bacterium]
MKFRSLAPYYFDGGGHNIEYQTCLKDAALSLGLEFELLLPKKHEVGEVPFPSKDYFHKRGKLLAFIACVRKPDLLFLETFGIKDLPGLFLASLFLHKKAKLCLLFRRGLSSNPVKRFALSVLSGLLAKRRGVKLLTDSEVIMRDLVGTKILPIPHAPTHTQPAPTSKIVCYWPGVPREAKGLYLIQQLANSIDQKRFELVAASASQLENTTLVDNYLPRHLYEAELNRADVILLPYNPVVYRSGTSGILVEAVCLGKLPLVRAGSWLAFELQKHDLHECIINWTAENIWEIIPKLLNDENVKSKLSGMQEHYLNFHNQITFNEMLAHQLQ